MYFLNKLLNPFKLHQMKNDVNFDQQELAEIFQIEELEKRYEMGWSMSASAGASQKEGWYVRGSVTYSF